MRRLTLVMFGFLASSSWCGVMGCHVSAKVPNYNVVQRGSYAYQQVNEGDFIVAAVDHQAMKQALAEIGCGTKYICEVGIDNDLVDVQVHSKIRVK